MLRTQPIVSTFLELYELTKVINPTDKNIPPLIDIFKSNAEQILTRTTAKIWIWNILYVTAFWSTENK